MKKLIKPEESLMAKYPEVSQEWDYAKNGDLTPWDVSPMSNKEVWWICKEKHEWPALISNRTRGSKCPYCSNKKAMPGFNDLATLFPEIAGEWNYEKNVGVTPHEIRPGTHEVFWWKCSKCGHEWKTSPHCRTTGKTGCPSCIKEMKTSFQEQAVYYYLKKYFPDTLNSDTETIGMELDVYIPSEKIAVEYDGANWHKGRASVEKLKNQLCKEKKIRLIRIREKGLDEDSDCELCIHRKNNLSDSDLTETIKKLLSYINGNLVVDVDVERDSKDIYSQYITREKKYSLQNLYPELAKEWHPELNENLTPDKLRAGSKKKMWWKCKKGHEWKSTIIDRVVGTGCPYCSGRKVLEGFNDLVTTSPELAAEWNYEKNYPLVPQQFNKGSNKRVYWKCSKGHEWRASILDRCKSNGTNCPVCSGHKVFKGFNDITTINPKLEAEWDYDKNGSLTPYSFTKGNHTKVWWKCKKGHEWEASIINRAVQGNGCPICSGHMVKEGYNDLATVNPKLASEWDVEKNELKASEVTKGSKKIVWWRCSKGHGWQTSVNNRSRGINCPICDHKKLLIGYNDLATMHPQIASEWHPIKNGNLTPSQVINGSKLIAWWICDKGHEWQVSINSRTSSDSKCPICQGKKVLAGYNDLATVNPALASQWDYINNGDLSPMLVTVGSGKKVWWRCLSGHTWQATVKERNRGTGCPFCYKERRKRH